MKTLFMIWKVKRINHKADKNIVKIYYKEVKV